MCSIASSSPERSSVVAILIVGNESGIAPRFRRSELSELAWSPARVTTTRFPWSDILDIHRAGEEGTRTRGHQGGPNPPTKLAWLGEVSGCFGAHYERAINCRDERLKVDVFPDSLRVGRDWHAASPIERLQHGAFGKCNGS